MPLIPQSVAGDVLMDFDSLKAAQSGLGTVRSGLYYVILTSSCCCLPCVPPWPVIICMNISHCIGSRTWMPLQAACPCRFSIAVDRVLKKRKKKKEPLLQAAVIVMDKSTDIVDAIARSVMGSFRPSYCDTALPLAETFECCVVGVTTLGHG